MSDNLVQGGQGHSAEEICSNVNIILVVIVITCLAIAIFAKW